MTRIINCWILALTLFAMSCSKDKTDGFLSPAIKYTNPTINASIGGTLIVTAAMVADESSKPLTFSIDAIRAADGKVMQSLMDYKVKTWWWKSAYTTKEKTAKEIDDKRQLLERPAIDINPENGSIIIYPEFDTLQMPKGKYTLDIRVKNSGGEMLIKNALTINISYALDYAYTFQGIDGNLTGIEVNFKRTSLTGNKIAVYFTDKNNNPVDPEKLIGYDYSTTPGVTDLKDWHNLGLENPTKYTAFPDHLELEVANFPLPYVAGKTLTIDMYNNGDINGAYFNFWFAFAIRKEGMWTINIKLNYK
ncbi:protein of unknown function [Chitinophaga jiangningensis]|uniref:DUF5007 domain-containing protein n=1 Tax=Chitinophaga jiangningensis TaxID=1419482 RepID=A0A1M7J1P3_9BACT|nr:DUF5007 domain-containing protein [Chitinophaga jiangningensis]SHM46980.1 protein of unknown function [Chitinophaga jiangningensis]